MKGFHPSRREVLSTLAGTGAALLLGSKRIQAAQLDPRIAGIIARNIIVDMHNHMEVPFYKNPAEAKPDAEIDLVTEIKRSGFIAINQTCDIDEAGVAVDDYYNLSEAILAFYDRLFERNHIRRALSYKDLQTAHANHQPVVIQAFEGGMFLEGHIERLEAAYKRGLRNLGLLHNFDGKGAPLGDNYGTPSHLGGLTAFGAEVIRECNRLGIVVDLAHGTDEMVHAALKVTSHPPIVSHVSLRSNPREGTGSGGMPPRLTSKEALRAVADAGGVIGVWWRFCDSMEEYVNSVRAMVDAMGIDHVGLGTDTEMTASTGLPATNRVWHDQNYGFFYSAADMMLKRGFTPDEVAKIGGGNFCRVFESITSKHA